jgi:hypothetical protein
VWKIIRQHAVVVLLRRDPNFACLQMTAMTIAIANLAFVRDHGIVRVQTNALYAVATKKE